MSGTSRTYILYIPSNYDSSKPYKLIFGLHWLGGSASDVASGTIIGGPYYGLESRSAGSAILVAPDGLPDPNQNNNKGWPNTNGQDVAFVKAMLQLFESNLCIDQSRIFSTGFSYGGIFSLTLGCQMSNVFRAIAPESGEFFGNCTASGAGPVAVWQVPGRQRHDRAAGQRPVREQLLRDQEPLHDADDGGVAEPLRDLPGLRQRISGHLV